MFTTRDRRRETLDQAVAVAFRKAQGPYPRILDTGCDYAAVGSVAARWAS